MRRSTKLSIGVLVVFSLILAACAAPAPAAETPQAEQPAATATTAPVAEVPANEVPATETPAAAMPENGLMIELPIVNPAEVTGSIYVAGSSTVFPLTEAIAEIFRLDGYGDEIKIDSIGSGAGFERFCVSGETDIANASRPIRDSEIESCQALSPARNPIEFRVGTDALAIVVHPENYFLTNATLEELALIFSDQATTWADVNPAWPAENIERFIPGTDSGSFDYFIEEVMTPAYGDDEEAARRATLNAANLQQSEDDNILAQGVKGSKYAVGFFGFAFFNENRDVLAALDVNGVTPDAESTEDGTYVLARPLFIYSDARIMQEKPQVAAFINFYLSNVNEIITEVGYFPASDDALDAARQAWLDAMK
ncbi:MAG TPA: phosphate ABC transporter substrate-binding protein PstS family protein [Levilinea sp.]|nr:phosphate ABC transporter substrate-binding protein PstS family protein [Levilinea sp.]